MRFYPGDYLGDTMHLSTIEHGAYFLLLMAVWRAPKNRVPRDDIKLAAITRLTPSEWVEHRETLLGIF